MKHDPTKYIKQISGDKVKTKISTVNITVDQKNFIDNKGINLSLFVRDQLNELMKRFEVSQDIKKDIDTTNE